jgi:hypothetical protein
LNLSAARLLSVKKGYHICGVAVCWLWISSLGWLFHDWNMNAMSVNFRLVEVVEHLEKIKGLSQISILEGQ